MESPGANECRCLIEFHAAIFARHCVRSDLPPRYGGLSPGEWGRMNDFSFFDSSSTFFLTIINLILLFFTNLIKYKQSMCIVIVF